MSAARALALLLLAGAGPLPGLGASDHRVRMDSATAPWSAVARLQIPGVSRCTAIIVAPTTVLTAAHCLWARRFGHFAIPGTVHVLSRYAAGGFAHHSVARAYRIADGFDPARPDPGRARDVAVVTLAEPVGNDRLALASDAPPPGAPAMLGGYNQDVGELIDADTACHVTAAATGVLLHDCAGTHGTSGAPLLIRAADGGWRVAGMQVAGWVGRSGGVAVAASMLQNELSRNGAPK